MGNEGGNNDIVTSTHTYNASMQNGFRQSGIQDVAPDKTVITINFPNNSP